MSNVVDLFFVFQFIKKLTTPFEEWDAYKYGIIDERGRILRKRRSLRTIKERQAWTKMDVMVLKLKRILAKIPGGSTRFGTYAAALWLIKESDRIEHGGDFITEEEIREELMQYMVLAEEVTGPVNSAGSGNVAGIGVGKDGEPGLTPDQMRRYKKGNRKMFRRRRP
jgi:hypothetical protein